MPKQTYAQNKPHIYKWVQNNREKYNEICKNKNKKDIIIGKIFQLYLGIF